MNELPSTPDSETIELSRNHVEDNNFDIDLIIQIEKQVFDLDRQRPYDIFERFISKYSIFYSTMANKKTERNRI